jgi:hypothetical protein
MNLENMIPGLEPTVGNRPDKAGVGKIVQYSDYYEQSSSRRMSLGAFLTD